MSHHRFARHVLLGALAVLGPGTLAGCSRKASGATAAPAETVTPVTIAPGETLPQIQIPLPPAAAAFGGRLQAEASQRATGTPTPEAMFGTLQVKGIVLHEVQQYMGSTWGARYCAGAKTDKEVFLSVCEYDDPKSAAAGKDLFVQVFAAAPRPTYVNKSSVLTVRDDARTPESAEHMKLLPAIFAGLK